MKILSEFSLKAQPTYAVRTLHPTVLISSNDTLANTCHTAEGSRGLNGCGQRCLCFLKIALIFFDRKRIEQSKGFDLAFQVAFTLLRGLDCPL